MNENITQNAIPLEKDNLSNNKLEINTRDIVFSIIFAVCSIVMSAFGIFGGFRAGFTVASILLLIVITFYFKTKEIKIGLYGSICFILNIGLAVNFSITSNFSVKFFSFFMILFLSLICFTSLITKEHTKGDLGILKDIFTPIIEVVVPNLPKAITSLLAARKNKILSKIFIGIISAIPVLFVVIPLLMSSDEAFSGMITLVFENTALLILKIVLGIIISLFLIAYCFSLKKENFPQTKDFNFKGLESAIIISFLSVLSICYLSYLFSQLAYFFSAFSGFLPKDYTFSLAEYARRGFFEMSIIAAINFIIIFAVLLISIKKNQKIHLISRILCTFISIFTLLIIATAISKMILYINNFGMTELRITTSVFMIFLTVVFITLLIRLYIPKVNVLKTGFIAAAILLIILGAVNINSVIAKYNYTAYKNGILTDIDVSTIYRLSDEGVPYLAELLNDENEDVVHLAKLNLSYCIQNYYETDCNQEFNTIEIGKKKYKDIGEFSFSKNKAYKILDKVLNEYPEIANYSNEYLENHQ